MLTDKMRGLVRAFRDLPFHVIGITHASADFNETTGLRYVQPMFQGKSLPNEIAGYFSAVGMMYREHESLDGDKVQVNHHVLFEGPEHVVCKVLPGLDSIEKPNVSEWLKKIMASSSDGSPRVASTFDPTAPRRKRRR